jgi:hypothetical protein
MPTCANCGRALQPGAGFCPGCGAVLWQSAGPGGRPSQPPAQWTPPPQHPQPRPQWRPSPQQQWTTPPDQQWTPPQAWAPPVREEPLLPVPLTVPDYERPPARHRRRGSRAPMVIIACAVVLVAAAVGVFVAVQRGRTPPSASAPPPSSVAQRPAAAPPVSTTVAPTTTTITTVPTTTTMTTTTTTMTTAESSAESELGQLVSSDHTAVEQMVGSWVPELSAKKIGMVVNGVTFDYQAILADYQQEAAAHPGALLLRSDDYSNFKLTGFYVTLAPQSFSNPSDANSWCDSQNIDAGDCYAVRIMHTGGYQGNAVFRG